MFSHLCLAICFLAWTISAQGSDKCDKCRQLVADFHRGVEETRNGGFQGGDVLWAEEKLNIYAKSELRFLEILERVCESKEFGCLAILEEFEDALEEWWKGDKEVDLFEWFCVGKVSFCCLEGSYGPNCSPCNEWQGLVCADHGKCVGDGTRSGDGTCQCNHGYTHTDCSVCSLGYYKIGHNDTFSCAVCDSKCVACDGPGASGCLECRSGFKMSAGRCEDVNECDSPDTCSGEEECINNEGAYECRALPSYKNEDKESEEATKTEL